MTTDGTTGAEGTATASATPDGGTPGTGSAATGGMEHGQKGGSSVAEKVAKITEKANAATKAATPPPAPTTPAYTPNFKFKANGEEKEFPENVRAFIKDKATEDYFRDLYSKADAFESSKTEKASWGQEKQQLGQRLQQTEAKIGEFTKGLQRINHFAQTDLDTFFEIYKIPPQKIEQWLDQKREMEGNPQLAQLYEERRTEAQRALQFQDQSENTRRENERLFQGQHQSAMHMALSHPEVTTFAQDFDKRFGAGAFRHHVEQHGDRVWNQERRYMPPHEAVKYVYDFYKRGFQTNSPDAQQPPQAAPQPPPAQAAPQVTPPIPNIGRGTGTTPTQQRFRNLKELRKHVADMTKEG